MTPTELRSRTKRFALDALKLVQEIPQTVPGKIIAGQLTRCATSVGANYRACCRAKSRADFASKASIVEEEADESAYWMELVIEGNFLSEATVRPLLIEAEELTKIMRASRQTAGGTAYRRNPGSGRNP